MNRETVALVALASLVVFLLGTLIFTVMGHVQSEGHPKIAAAVLEIRLAVEDISSQVKRNTDLVQEVREIQNRHRLEIETIGRDMRKILDLLEDRQIKE